MPSWISFTGLALVLHANINQYYSGNVYDIGIATGVN
jgi:hypothetical protein